MTTDKISNHLIALQGNESKLNSISQRINDCQTRLDGQRNRNTRSAVRVKSEAKQTLTEIYSELENIQLDIDGYLVNNDSQDPTCNEIRSKRKYLNEKCEGYFKQITKLNEWCLQRMGDTLSIDSENSESEIKDSKEWTMIPKSPNKSLDVVSDLGGSKASEGSKASDSSHDESPKASDSSHDESPKASDSSHDESPKASDSSHGECSTDSNSSHDESPKASECSHDESPKASECSHDESPKASECSHDESPKAYHPTVNTVIIDEIESVTSSSVPGTPPIENYQKKSLVLPGGSWIQSAQNYRIKYDNNNNCILYAQLQDCYGYWGPEQYVIVERGDEFSNQNGKFVRDRKSCFNIKPPGSHYQKQDKTPSPKQTPECPFGDFKDFPFGGLNTQTTLPFIAAGLLAAGAGAMANSTRNQKTERERQSDGERFQPFSPFPFLAASLAAAGIGAVASAFCEESPLKDLFSEDKPEDELQSRLQDYMLKDLENVMIKWKRDNQEVGSIFEYFLRDVFPEHVDVDGDYVRCNDERVMGKEWKGTFDKVSPNDTLHELGDIPGTTHKTYTKARASHILVSSKTKAEKIKARILEGNDFGNLSRRYSKCHSKHQNGDLGWFKKGIMEYPFDKVCFLENIGEVHGPFKTRHGWHLIKTTDRE